MAESQNTRSPSGRHASITRRNALKATAAAAVAAPVAAVPAVIAPSPAAAAGIQPYTLPAGVQAITEIYSYARTTSPHLQFVLEDETFRPLDDDESRDWLSSHPYSMQNAEPDDLRRLFADSDGELFALFAERHQLRSEGSADEQARLLDAICAMPCVTDAGAVMKLRLLADSMTPWGRTLSMTHMRQLLRAALEWLSQRQMDRMPLEVRPVDCDRVAELLDIIPGWRAA